MAPKASSPWGGWEGTFLHMSNKRRHSPWLWIPSLCAAEEIPSAMVTYVALLMFVQFGESNTMASLYGGLLFLPWIMKSYLRSKVRNAGYFKRHIHIVEACIFVCISGTTLYLDKFYPNPFILFVQMFVVCFFCAWHELLARMYYNRMLYPRQQLLYNKTKIFASQSTIVLTYGVLIIVVGFTEVLFRSYRKAWAMENCLLAGVFLLFLIVNLFVLQNPRIHNPYRYESLVHAFKNEFHIVERIRQKQYSFRIISALFFLLLPQALMFNTRVFFLMEPIRNGGLGCSIQDVGFAQGTIGVIAFSIGITLGRLFLERYDYRKMFWFMAIPLTLSPLCYVFMSQCPIYDDMQALCCMTFLAQFCFGFGLNICMHFVHYISNERYRNTINYLYVPMVAGVMIVPVCLSGFLADKLGFKTFFLIDILTAPLAWCVVAVLGVKRILNNNEQ